MSTHTPPTTRETHIATPGALGELFWLLAHPMSATLAALALLTTLATGGGLHEALPQALGGLIAFSAIAQALTQPTARLPLTLWAAGGVSLAAGVALSVAGAGRLTLLEGGRAESYERGGEISVAHHLGATLSLTRVEGPAGAPARLRLSLGAVTPQEVDLSDLSSGRLVTLGPWSLSLERAFTDHAHPRALVTLTPRTPPQGAPAHKTLWMRDGDTLSPDGTSRVSALKISGGYNAPRVGLLGAAIELEQVWEGGRERAWHFADLPQLSEIGGAGPSVVRVERVEPSPAYVMSVRAQGSAWLLWVGVALWLAAYAAQLTGRASLRAPA
jgi:hypothetical protein